MIKQGILPDNYVVVAEEEILMSSRSYAEIVDEEDNDFLQLLKAGETYRQAGLTPLYLYGQTTGLAITSAEYAQRSVTLQ